MALVAWMDREIDDFAQRLGSTCASRNPSALRADDDPTVPNPERSYCRSGVGGVPLIFGKPPILRARSFMKRVTEGPSER